jgi:hypothetical protein
MAQRKETKETKKKIKVRDLKPKKDAKGGASNGARGGYRPPHPWPPNRAAPWFDPVVWLSRFGSGCNVTSGCFPRNS